MALRGIDLSVSGHHRWAHQIVTLSDSCSQSLSFGWTLKAPGIEDFHERVSLVVDADFRLGAIFPMEGSVLGDTVSPTFGLTAGAGITF